MLEKRLAQDRGRVRLSWLDSKHSFSFGRYYDPKHLGFSDLCVINDDHVQAGKGFGTHSHQDMEIFSYVLSGQLAHQDSLGMGGVLEVGDVQLMSAGTGVAHSEFNPSDEQDVHFLQIWLMPSQVSLTPNYQQGYFDNAAKRGQLCLVISPDGRYDSLKIQQDAYIYAGLFDGQEQASLTLEEPRFIYIHLVKGRLQVNSESLSAGDGLKIRHESSVHFSNGQQAEVLVFNLRPIEQTGP